MQISSSRKTMDGGATKSRFAKRERRMDPFRVFSSKATPAAIGIDDLDIAMVRKSCHPSPIYSVSKYFPNWPVRATTQKFTPPEILSIFTGLQATSPSGMNLQMLANIASKEDFLHNLTEIVDSFFPVDAPFDHPDQVYVSEQIRKAICENETAQLQQCSVLFTLLSYIGIFKSGDEFYVDPYFTLEQCTLLNFPKGHQCLAQIIRSLTLLNNHTVALKLKNILLQIGLRYQIPTENIAKILIADAPNYWQIKEGIFGSEQAILDKELSSDFELPIGGLVKLGDPLIPIGAMRRTGVEIADFFLGYKKMRVGEGVGGQFIFNIIKNAKPDELFSTNSLLAASLFPTTVPVIGPYFVPTVTEDVKKCFLANALLSSVHRLIADLALKQLGLRRISTIDKVLLDTGKTAEDLSWLKLENRAERRFILRMMKSLYLLGNEQLAIELQKKIMSLISTNNVCINTLPFVNAIPLNASKA